MRMHTCTRRDRSNNRVYDVGLMSPSIERASDVRFMFYYYAFYLVYILLYSFD